MHNIIYTHKVYTHNLYNMYMHKMHMHTIIMYMYKNCHVHIQECYIIFDVHAQDCTHTLHWEVSHTKVQVSTHDVHTYKKFFVRAHIIQERFLYVQSCNLFTDLKECSHVCAIEWCSHVCAIEWCSHVRPQ